MKVSKTMGFGVVLLLLASGALVAQDIPLHNWTVPPYNQSSHSGGITTMTDVTLAHPFVGVAPCRVADTRGNGAPIQGGIFGNSTERTWDLTGICGIPAGAEAISVNFTVVSAAGIPAGSFLLTWPTGGAPPPTAVMTYGPNQILSNAAIVVLGSGDAIEVNVSGSTHIIMDVNGYWAPIANAANNAFVWETSNTGTFGAGIFQNNNTSSSTTFGLVGRVQSTGNNSQGVRGLALGAGGRTYGVFGQSSSTATEAAGVKGLSASGELPVSNCCSDIGVLGVSKDGYGTVGISNDTAGLFLRYDTAGNVLGFTWLATSLAGGYGVYVSNGNYGGTGLKYFVEPHPTDPNKVIRYVSLEGAESGTYFRGRGKFQNGVARISVPEDFRIVTDDEGLSIQVTPIGQMATVAVQTINLNEIVVRGSRNVEFFYTVNGVRRAYKDHQAINEVQGNGEFMPLNADWKMPEYPAELKKRLIQNGTYKPDGTVNMETAHSLGWDKIWEAKSRPVPQPVADTP